jgi:hypothetical protein
LHAGGLVGERQGGRLHLLHVLVLRLHGQANCNRDLHSLVNEVSVSQQLARRDRHFLHAGNHPERANAAQAPAPLGAIYGFLGEGRLAGQVF